MAESRPLQTPLTILIPVFDDWEAAAILLSRLNDVANEHHLNAGVLIVDDGSTEIQDPPGPFNALRKVQILELRRNLGHQRAIAVGLAYLQEHVGDKAVVVMDADGEDDPIHVPSLLQRFETEQGRKVVFAGRTRRSESLLFRTFYRLYKAVHRITTGYKVEVGNFSILPAAIVSRLVVVSDLWNHFAASIYKARVPFVTVPTPRGTRFRGKSKMNFVSLVVHGLSAVSVFSDLVGIRLLLVLGVLIALSLAALLVVIGVKIFTSLAIPGWTTYAVGLLVVILLQMVTIALVAVFQIIGNHAGGGFLPIRDYRYFVLRVRTVEGTADEQ